MVFEGEKRDRHLVAGYLKCDRKHLYQVKEEIGLLKDPKLSTNEFEWKINVADERKYDEIRGKYDSYLTEDQKAATNRMKSRLVDLVAASSETDRVVLDVATGMGTFILPLAEKTPRDALIIGTDIDEKPLRGAMNKAKKAGTSEKLSLLVTDAKHLAFKNNSLSTISSYFGLDNVSETAFAFKESSRVLRERGNILFSSLWLKEGSRSMRLAEQHNVCQIASEKRLKKVLDDAGLVLEQVEAAYSGIWPHNPMDLLPVEGDEYKHVIVQARKRPRSAQG
jgi:ubiquinone/menaquinone biosynthesis C-methylase UbiE